MQQTDNYEMNLPEGSDLVNLLTDYNPNFETIDEEMKNNSIASIGTATELKSGTVHALTRNNPDAAMFRFVATADWEAGDTVTVDTVQVTALLPNGEALGSGSYVINSNVLCCLVGTLLTVFVPQGTISTADNALKLGGELPAYYGTASDVQTATNVANAASLLVNQLNSNLNELDGRVTVLENRSFSWTLLGNVTGSTPITLPEQYSELHIYVERADGKAKITGNIIAEDVADSADAAYVFGGVNGNSLGSNQCAGLKINNGTIWLFRYTDGSTDTTSTAKLKVYTR